MNTRLTTNAEQQVSPGLDCEALLQSEIEFWQEVIAACPVTQSAESLERMHQALALAETRLARVSETSAPAAFLSSRKQ
jgi:hypothetical protein